jgi:release factor glutamine methyltransferase
LDAAAVTAPRHRGPTLGEALAQALTRLAASIDAGPEDTMAIDDARADAEILLAEATGRPRHHAYAWPDARLEPAQIAAYRALVERRARGEPVAHISARRGFWTFELEVTTDTLIPRPETERLVEIALALAPGRGKLRALDLGTGTGAVALALATERPGWTLVASDVAQASLQVARRNAARLGVRNIGFRRGDWLGAVAGERFDLIVSNPPYVADGDAHLEHGDVRFEPRLALLGGTDGLDAVRAIAADAGDHLEPGGWLALEHGFDQGAALRALLAALGYDELLTHRDHAGHERVTIARLPR